MRKWTQLWQKKIQLLVQTIIFKQKTIKLSWEPFFGNKKINLISSSTEKTINKRHIEDSAQVIEFVDKARTRYENHPFYERYKDKKLDTHQ